MTHPAYIKEKARQLRVEKDLTIDEIAKRQSISRQTIFHWVRDLPMQRPRRASPGRLLGSQRMQDKYKKLRDDAYEQGWTEFDELVKEPMFRDFVCMYIGEGYKRNRNTVSLCNSDPKVIVLADHFIRRFARNPVKYAIQYHADQDPDDLRDFWGRYLHIEPESIRVQRKSNSNQLKGRSWRSVHGVLTVFAGDTLFRARLQAWIDRTFEEWLHLPARGA